MAETARPQLAEPRGERHLPPDRNVPAPVPRAANPFGGGEPPRAAASGLISVEQQRSIAEVQARMIIARANPRDPIRAVEQILNDCTRPTLANAAVYQYARGGTDISGPTIRLAEAIAQRWGNIASGLKEVSRNGEFSECVAYAWDLETGYYDERQFQVRHWRDTRGGGYALTDERDIYELIANFGQRRKRAVLLTVIPGDVTEAALEQCESTMSAIADTSGEGVRRLIGAFGELGVDPAQIEARIQRRLDAIRPAQIVALRRVFNSLRDGMSEVGDWFDTVEGQHDTQAPAEAPPAAVEAATRPPSGDPPDKVLAGGAAAPARPRGRPRARQAQSSAPTTPRAPAVPAAPAAPAPAAQRERPAARPAGRGVNFEV
jgi:hypothetical protein